MGTLEFLVVCLLEFFQRDMIWRVDSRILQSTSLLVDWQVVLCSELLGYHHRSAGCWTLCQSYPSHWFRLQSRTCKLQKNKEMQLGFALPKLSFHSPVYQLAKLRIFTFVIFISYLVSFSPQHYWAGRGESAAISPLTSMARFCVICGLSLFFVQLN